MRSANAGSGSSNRVCSCSSRPRPQVLQAQGTLLVEVFAAILEGRGEAFAAVHEVEHQVEISRCLGHVQRGQLRAGDGGRGHP